MVKPQVLVKETTLLGITLLAGVIIIPRYTLSSATNSSGTNYWRQKNNSYTASLKNNPGLISLSYDGANFITRIDGTQIDTVGVTGLSNPYPLSPSD